MNQKRTSQNIGLLATTPGRPAWPGVSSLSAVLKAVAGAAKLMIKTLMATAVLVALAASASAQTVAYTANVNTSYGGASTGNTLNMGQIFSVNGAGIEVFQLGFFDYQNHPLASSHTVTLFSGQTAIASVTIPAGSAAPLLDSYAFEPLSTPIYLPAGSYTVLSYGVDGSDPYGEGSSGNVGFNGSANLTAVNTCFDFTTQGSPDYPGGAGDTGNPWSVTWGDPSADASFTYTNVAWPSSTWTGGGVNNNWSTSGNWNTAPGFPSALLFAGSAQLTNNNDNTGITVEGITFDSAAGAFVLGGNDITLGGNIGFNGNPATPVTQTINLNMDWSTSITIDTPTNGNLALDGAITSPADLTKLDAGTLTLGGTNTIESMDVDGGTNIISGNTMLSANNTSGNYDRFYVGDGDSYPGSNGTLIIQPGAVLNIIGTLNDSGVIGRDSGSGTVIQNGGTFTYNPGNQSFLVVGATSEAGTTAAYDMNGGVLDLSLNNLGVGLGNGVLTTGVVNQVSGIITNVNNLQLGAIVGIGRGVYTLSGGSISIGAGGITTVSGNYAVNLGGGTVGAQASWSSPLNINLTGNNGPVTFNPGGYTIALSGVLSGSGGLTVTGAGTLDLSGTASYLGNTTVSTGSTLELDSTGSNPGTFHLANGALMNLNFSGTYIIGGCNTNGVALAVGTYNSGNLPGFISGPGSLQVVSGVSTGLWTGDGANNNWSTAGNWNQSAVPVFPIGLTFAGSTRLLNNNDLSSITVDSITFDSAAGAFVLGGDGITLIGNIGFNGNPAASVTQTVDLDMAWNSSEYIDTPANGNLSLGGNITSSSDSSLIKVDVGGLTLGGTNTITSWDLDGGTTTITGNTTINGDGSGRIYVGDGDYLAECNGTLVIQPGAVLDISGNYVDDFVIGRDGGSGTVIQNGGTFIFNNNRANMWIGATGNSATRSEYHMNGGLLDLTGHTFGVGLGAGVLITGAVYQVSGVITNVGNLWLGGATANGYGAYTASGGSIYIGAGGITTFSGLYGVNLGGVTVGAGASWSSPLNMTLTGSNGPATFNPADNTITLSGVLSGSGGLVLAGAGTLDLSGANSYTGNTTVSTGSTLELDQTGSNPGTFSLANGAVLDLTFSGTYVVGACYTNGVALAGGVYTSVNLPGFITGSGSLTVSSAKPPVVNRPIASGGNLILTGSGGSAGAHYTWLTSTNVTTPIALWVTNTTGNFDGSGDFSNAIPISISTPAKFFRLRTP
jgi:fibronectin-binding autotransporter adhesin